MSLEPVQLLIKVYDFTIVQCKKKDQVKASKGIVELISALNFDHDGVSLGFFRLYQFCQDKIKKDQFEEAIPILEGLREAWVEAEKKNGKSNGEKKQAQ
ncbi:flagellar protein FliS [candidate division KSB1 bacterium]